jgi:apolipoprotein N-acyltransferase
MERSARYQGLLLAAAGGILFALTSPPTDLYPAIFLGLALLAASATEARTTWRAFGRGAAWATAAGIVGLRFVPSVIQRFTPLGAATSYLALVLLAAAQSLIWAIGAAVTHAVHRRARAPIEIAFAAGMLVAVSLPSIFAWTPAGLLSPWPSLVQLADIIGERGVSVIFAVIAALLVRAARSARAQKASAQPLHARRNIVAPLLGAIGILGALVVYGRLRMDAVGRAGGEGSLRVALVNQAVGPEERWDPKNVPAILQKLHTMTREAEAQGVDLTVWPEAAYPYPLDHGATQAPRGPRAILGDGVHGPVLFGLLTLDQVKRVGPSAFERNSFNSATLLMPDGALQPPYDKLELLWFGETVPGGQYLPWLRRLFQKSGGLIPGAEPRALSLPRDGAPPVRMGVLNCYEDTLPGVGRRIAGALAPNLLVNVTNDAWFLGTAEPELHARLGAMRAIEHRLDLVRAVNMGVASWIDARGVVMAREAGIEPSLLLAKPTIRAGVPTIYGRLGDAPLAVLLGLGVALSAFRSRRTGKPELPPEKPNADAGAVEPDRGAPGEVAAQPASAQVSAPEGAKEGEGATPPPNP